jgi:hypothetical protein
MEDQKLGDDSLVVQADGSLSATVDDKAVLLSQNDGIYFEMNHVGTRIWEKIESPYRVVALREWMIETFDLSQTEAEDDLNEFLSDLRELDLIHLRSAENEI